jgi:DNA polymerase III gamma/tau subunit
MQSILIVGNKEDAKNKAEILCSENKVSKFDKDIIESEKALGIPDIRLLQKRVFLKPIKSEIKAVIIEAFYGITLDGQNSFLKLLEEPPDNTIIIILSSDTESFLPTIISRCTIINLKKSKKLENEENKDNIEILNKLLTGKNSFYLAQEKGKSREVALNFLEELIITCEKNLEKEKKFGKIIKEIQKTFTIIKSTNISPRFALENLFLSLK